MRWVRWLIAAVVFGGCAADFPRPMAAADVARVGSGEALVAYLRQGDASPAVCDLRSKGAHIPNFGRDAADALVDALQTGKIGPALGRTCIERALETGSPEVAAVLVDVVARAYHGIVTDGEFERAPSLQARAAALQTVYVDRPGGRDGHPRTVGPLFDDLRRRFFGGHFGPVGAGYVNELLGVVDLERGQYGGRPVDLATIDALAARGDEALLQRFADRLPFHDLAAQAERRVVRLRIAASPFPEIRAQAKAVEARVMRDGINRVSLDDQPVVRAWVDPGKLPARNVFVRQDLFHQTAAVFGYRGTGKLSVIPDLSLGGALWVDVAGLSRPITVCGAPRSHDPTPCLGGDDVSLENPLAESDRDGTFRFREKASEGEVVALTRTGNAFPLSIDVGGRRQVAFRWPIRYGRPSDLILSARAGRGPALQVVVRHVNPALYVFSVSGDGRLYQAVIEKDDLATFHVVSRGAAGKPGVPGTSGMDGLPGLGGTSASCPSFAGNDGGRGGDGSPGGNGGPGGNGADGGDVVVQLQCGAAACPSEDVALFRRVVLSEGGPGGSGGAGGPGGRGGRGGSGGAGATCFDPTTNTSSSVSGGSDGPSGSDGAAGIAGPDGAPGRPGVVRIETVRAPATSGGPSPPGAGPDS